MSTPPQGTGLGRRLAGNAVASATGRIIVLLMWLALTPPLVRALGPEAFGVWALFYALSFWLLSLDLGLSQIAMRHVSASRALGEPDGGGDHATLALSGYTALGVLAIAAAALLSDAAIGWLRVPAAVEPAARWSFIAGGLVMVLSGVVQTIAGTLQAHDRFDLASGAVTATALCQGLGIMLGLATAQGLSYMIGAVVVGWILGAIVSLALLRHGAPRFRFGSLGRAWRHRREVWEFGGPVQISNFLAVSHQQVDKVLLARWVALAAVTPYEIGMRVAAAASSFPQFITTAIYPTATEMWARGDRAALAVLHGRSTRWVLAVSAMVTCGLVGAASPLLRVWLGGDSPDAALALQALAVAAYLASPAGPASILARATGRPALELEWSGVALLVHLAIAALLMPALGLRGILIAMCVANAVSSVWFLLRLGRALSMPIRAVLWDTFGAPVVAQTSGVALGLWLTRLLSTGGQVPALGVAIAAGVGAVAVCGALLTVTRFVDPREAWSLLRRGAAA